MKFLKSRFIKKKLSPEDIVVNQIAQEKISFAEGLIWFDDQNMHRQRKIISGLWTYLERSNAEQEQIDEAVPLIPIEPTHTSIALLKTQPFRAAVQKICSFPDNKTREAFIAMMTLFKYVDTKVRENVCKDNCEHPWHNLES